MGNEDRGILVEGTVHARRTMVDHFPIGDGSRPFASIVSPFGAETREESRVEEG